MFLDKAVIVLDRGAKFADAVEKPFELCVKEGSKTRKVGECNKSVWTWCLEGIYELHRVLLDAYPRRDPQIRFVVSDFMARQLESQWPDQLYTRADLIKLLGTIESPSSKNVDINPIGGLTMAVEALTESTNSEMKYKESSVNDKDKIAMKTQNDGILIVFTRMDSDEEVSKLEEEIAKLIESKNEIASNPSNNSSSPVSRVRLYILNFSTNDNCNVSTRPLKKNEKFPILESWVISRNATDMFAAIHSLLISAFELNSTTVMKIPMKEDQKGNTGTRSSNYDVELFHAKSVHYLTRKLTAAKTSNSNECSKTGVTYETTKLSWATVPKSKWSLFPEHRVSVPCTPAEANSRPSACLTQFVMEGRCVLLDLERDEQTAHFKPNVNGKYLISHMLIANKGRIFIHAINFAPESGNNDPKIKEPKEKRMRKNESLMNTEKLNKDQFKFVMKQMKLDKIDVNRLQSSFDKPSEKSLESMENTLMKVRERFMRITNKIPALANEMILFQPPVFKHFESLLNIVSRNKIVETELTKCYEEIGKIAQKRSDGPLIEKNERVVNNILKNVNTMDGPWKIALKECDEFLVNHCHVSENHMAVYNNFNTTFQMSRQEPLKRSKYFEFPTLGDSAARDEFACEKAQSQLYFDREIIDKGGVKIEKLMEHNAEQHTKNVTSRRVPFDAMLELCNRIEAEVSKTRREFVGREMYGDKAVLYKHLAQAPAANVQDERMRGRSSGTPPPSRINRY